MAGQDKVPAQQAFLEENGCSAGRYSACDVIILSEPNRPADVVVKDIAIGAGSFEFDFEPVPAVSSVGKRTGNRCGRSGVQFPGRSNRQSVADGSPPLRRFCVPQALSRRDGPQWRTQGRGSGVNILPPSTIAEKMKPFCFETNILFFVRNLPKLLPCFFLFCPTFYLL